MKGFVAPLLLVIFICALSFVLYTGLLSYSKYKAAEYAVDSLKVTNSGFTNLSSFKPGTQAVLKPKTILAAGEVSYFSPFPPCIQLVEDRKWQIYASQNNLLQGYFSRMYYDRLWQVVWLGMLPKDENPTLPFTFYGPFRIEDMPRRTFMEQMVIGRDVVGEDGSINIAPKDACALEDSTYIQLR